MGLTTNLFSLNEAEILKQLFYNLDQFALVDFEFIEHPSCLNYKGGQGKSTGPVWTKGSYLFHFAHFFYLWTVIQNFDLTQDKLL
jgi:hypothetical protein